MKQVIGLTNEDPVSTEFRPLKQIIERMNRTFKGNYRSTHGFGSDHGSVSFVTLFAAYFNFLRPHTSLEGKVDGDPTNNLSYHGTDSHPMKSNKVETGTIASPQSYGLEPAGQHSVPKTTHEKVIDFSKKAVFGQTALDATIRELKEIVLEKWENSKNNLDAYL